MAPPKKKAKKPIASKKQLERYHELIRENGPGYWLAKRKITPCSLAKEIDEHLKATSVKVFNNGGEVVYSDPMVDWNVRWRALELAVKLWGMMPKEKIELDAADSLIDRIMEARKRAGSQS